MESLPQEHSAREGGLARGLGPPDCLEELPEILPQVSANDTHLSLLVRTIEQEIIPRLMLAHQSQSECPSTAGHAIDGADVRQFAKLVLSHEEEFALSTIQTLRQRGVSVEKIYLELLAPTARYLGELWEEDLCNFTEVTIGLGRLQRVLRELSPALGRSVEHPVQGRRVLLLPSPGEQHTFGLVMVAEFFRRAGWDVTGGSWMAGVDAVALVSAEWFDAIGFSLGAEVHLGALAASIEAVRHATCNRDLKVLVGGPLFGVNPDYVSQVGADGMTIDGREAPMLAEILISGKSHQHEPPG